MSRTQVSPTHRLTREDLRQFGYPLLLRNQNWQSMYEVFIQSIESKPNEVMEKYFSVAGVGSTEIKTLFAECGDRTFRDGLYKIHNPESSANWTDIIGKYFPQFKSVIIAFGYDWFGRQYTLDITRKDHIIMFDPATFENLSLDQDLVSFHNHDLVSDRNSFLSEQFFQEAIKFLHVSDVKYTDCVGHKLPLFLNGSDVVENLEIVNMEVYREFQCQLYLQIKDLPPGTKINSVKFT